MAGVTYYFAVDGYDGATGKVVLNLSETVTAVRTAVTPANGTKASPHHLEGPALLTVASSLPSHATIPQSGSVVPAATIAAKSGDQESDRHSLDGISGNGLASLIYTVA